MSYKNSLVTTTDKIVKEGINDMEIKPNVVKKSITPSIAKNNIDKVNKTEKPQASINQAKANHWINQGILKELKQKTQ